MCVCVQCTWWKVQIPKAVAMSQNNTAISLGEGTHIEGIADYEHLYLRPNPYSSSAARSVRILVPTNM